MSGFDYIMYDNHAISDAIVWMIYIMRNNRSQYGDMLI